jgi:DNA-binding CsgD family transcriptional regulator/PAS domain-containing protein
MGISEPLLRTIESIYSVPGNPECWGNAVDEISSLVGAAAGVYLLIDAENQQTEVAGISGFTAEDVRAYEGAQAAAKDVRYKYIGNLVPGTVFREFEYVPDRAEYDASEWIQYQLKSLGAYWCMTAQVSTHGLWHDYISVNRLLSRGPHTEEEKSDLQALIPHLSRAAELHRTMMRLENRYGAVLAVLDKLLVGLVILDLKGRVAVANVAARRVCDESGGLSLAADGRLHACRPHLDARLQALIASTSRTAEARDRCEGGSVVIPKRSRAGCLLAEVMPLRDDGFSDRDNLRGTAVFILDPNSPHVVSTEGLAKIFELTSTEHEVTHALVNGAEPKKIAQDRDRSIETVRCQIKNIFFKTGVKTRLDLIRLAVKANPPIEGA